MTLVDRATRCLLAFRVTKRCEWSELQSMVWRETPPAAFYFSDGYGLYGYIGYPGIYQSVTDKSQTFCVEGVNAEMRHYLARLARSSRCFSRSEEALHRAVTLFAHAWNKRQLHKAAHPRYKTNLQQHVNTN